MTTEQIWSGTPGKSVDAYNYESFDYGSEADEFERWLRDGPAIGAPAPDFELADLDGNCVRLIELRGRPVVLEFGSYTCPIFSDRVPAMEQLARQHPEAIFRVIYVREAHPGEIRGAHRSLADKRSAAHKLALEEALTRRVLVDSLDGATHRAYGGAWNPVYVISPVVSYGRRGTTPRKAAALHALQAGAQTGHCGIHGYVARTERGPPGPAAYRTRWTECAPALLSDRAGRTSGSLAEFVVDRAAGIAEFTSTAHSLP
jgi:hypothetical protein